MEKIIFLDIDGVLNVIQEGHDKYGAIFHKHFVDNLRNLVNSTGAKIVISSTWRQSGLSVMQDMWKDRNYPGEIIDITPDCFTIVNEGICEFYDTVDRGHEIQYWLDRHPEVTHYVILDDDNDMLDSQRQNFVRTANNKHHTDFVDIGYGLTKECAEQAIDILNEGDDTTYSITCGERDENGFADTYRNGKKTNVRMLLFTEEQVERLQAIQVEYTEPKEKWYKKVLNKIFHFIID